jgi:site-specific DNA-methyltransferase (adenine-specific)
VKLLKGDCLEAMKTIPDNSIDLVLADPPYGITACKWDSVIDLEKMWCQLKRIRKERTPIVLFGSEPFSSALRMSNIKEYKYDWIWKKNKGSNFQSVKIMPFKEHENVSIFYRKQCLYNPQKILRSEAGKKRLQYVIKMERGINPITNMKTRTGTQDKDTRSPMSVLYFNCESGVHPTQKPVALLEYLIKTYTNENDLVLDFCMGSGSTGVAALNLKRAFIGIEKEEKYYEIAKDRMLNERN